MYLFTGILYRVFMYYKYHVFFCTNQRQDGRACCQDHDAAAMRNYAKDRVKQLGLAVPGGVRVNTAGCMGRCSEGPTMAVYPQGIWYRYDSQADIDEIIDTHLVNDRPVERLQI